MSDKYISDKHTNNEICIMLESLTTKVDIGFSGMHSRQDLTNGNVRANTEFRLKTAGALAVLKLLVGFFSVGTIVNLIITIYSHYNI